MPSRGSATPSDCGTGGGGGVSGQMADTHTSSRLLGVAQLLDEIRFDPQRRSTDPPESALTSNCRSMSGLEVDGAAEFGALRRLRRRPRRQPAVSAAARAWAVTRGGQARRRGRARPPQLPTVAVYILAQVHHARWSIFCFQKPSRSEYRTLFVPSASTSR